MAGLDLGEAKTQEDQGAGEDGDIQCQLGSIGKGSPLLELADEESRGPRIVRLSFGEVTVDEPVSDGLPIFPS